MKTSPVKPPDTTQFTLLLIREELKSRRLFHFLGKAGFHDSYFQPHLDMLILDTLGINDQSDETFAIYESIIEKRSLKIEADNQSVTKQAMKAYHELLNEKKKLKK
jgi:hypothetical protein